MPSKKSPANRALARAIRSTRERRGYSQEGFPAMSGWTAPTSARSSVASSTCRSIRS
jgi:hypothetical protein